MVKTIERYSGEPASIPASATESLCHVGQVTRTKLFAGGHLLCVPHFLGS